jgi:hypothetical protein
MPASVQAAPISKTAVWAGRIVSAIPILLLTFSAVLKFMKPAPVVEGMVRYGYPEALIFTLGVLELLCCIVYAIPRTSVLGAILMTGYLGGATATNLRIGDPSYYMTVLLGVLAWLGLFLRDERVRAFFRFLR